MPVGRSWGALGRSWAPLGRLLDASEAQLEKVSRGMELLSLNLEPKIHSSWLQNPLKIDMETNNDFEARFFRIFGNFQKNLQTQPTLTPSKK